ncbi:MAG: LuxR C-terminal-related transcriptional regulator [Cellvibrionaceae bacterium]|nr:LuxR C-terminal-related transcriptional regulator [Cellvibrionaceae bacterium]
MAELPQRFKRQALRHQARAGWAELSGREREVAVLVAEGLSNKALAEALGISIKTVEIHRSRVMKKMAAQSLAQLVQMLGTLAQP